MPSLKKQLTLLAQIQGFSLLEAIVSLLILSSGTMAAFTLFNYTNRLYYLSSHQFIATNLAREGLEMMRQVRDTNWLNNHGNMREHWNDFFKPPTLPSSIPGDPSAPYYPRYYFPFLNVESTNLPASSGTSPFGSFINLDDTRTVCDLSNEDSFDSCTSSYALCLVNNLYTTCPIPLTSSAETTPYSRQIKIVYEEDNNPDPTNPTVATVYSIVAFRDQSNVKNVTLITHLTDWLER